MAEKLSRLSLLITLEISLVSIKEWGKDWPLVLSQRIVRLYFNLLVLIFQGIISQIFVSMFIGKFPAHQNYMSCYISVLTYEQSVHSSQWAMTLLICIAQISWLMKWWNRPRINISVSCCIWKPITEPSCCIWRLITELSHGQALLWQPSPKLKHLARKIKRCLKTWIILGENLNLKLRSQILK